MFTNVFNIKTFALRHLIRLIGSPEYLTIQLDITNSCNLNCSHCYHSDHINLGAISLDVWYEILNQYKALIDKLNTKPSFVICGGEPLLSKNFVPLVERIRTEWTDAPISVLTNGTLLNAGRIDLLKKNKIEIQVSLDGPTSETHDRKRGRGNFERSVRGIQKALDHNLTVHILAVLSKTTASQIEIFFKLGRTLGVYSMNFTRLIPMGNGRKMVAEGDDVPLVGFELRDAYRLIVEASKKFGVTTNTNKPLFCLIDKNLGASARFGFQGLVVDYKGNLKVSSRTDFIVGNIMEDGLENLFLNHPLLKNLRRGKIKGCDGCEFINQCGGDRNVAYATSKDFLGFDQGCWKYQLTNREGESNENQKNDHFVAGNVTS